MAFAPGDYNGFYESDFLALRNLNNETLNGYLSMFQPTTATISGQSVTFYIFTGNDNDYLDFINALEYLDGTYEIASFHYIKSTWTVDGF